MPEPEAFAHLVGALGIDEHTRVVVYDAGGPPTAGVVVWAFLYYGHLDTGLLDGGLTKWTAGQIVMAPITYMVDGRQYVLVISGHTLVTFGLRVPFRCTEIR